MITGEVGAGKTVAARAALAGLDQARHTVIYLADPTVGARGIHHADRHRPRRPPAHGTAALTAQAADLLAAEHAERGRTPVLVIDEAHLLDPTSSSPSACSPTTTWTPPALSPACSSASPPCAAAPPRPARRPRPADRPALRHARHDQPRRPPATSPTTSSSPAGPTPCSATTPSPHPRRRPRTAPRRQQPRHPGPRRRLRRTQGHRRRAQRPRRRHRGHDRLTTTPPARTPRPRRHPPAGPSTPAVHTGNDPYILIFSDREHLVTAIVAVASALAARRLFRPVRRQPAEAERYLIRQQPFAS